jgi:hypothetical protein
MPDAWPTLPTQKNPIFIHSAHVRSILNEMMIPHSCLLLPIGLAARCRTPSSIFNKIMKPRSCFLLPRPGRPRCKTLQVPFSTNNDTLQLPPPFYLYLAARPQDTKFRFQQTKDKYLSTVSSYLGLAAPLPGTKFHFQQNNDTLQLPPPT